MSKMKMRKKLALIIPAHNEAMVIDKLLYSAIEAGQDAADIYVVDDSSTDRTGAIARKILGKDNVARLKRGGKGRAIEAGVDKFDLTSKYQWVHIADADGIFDKDYFKIFKRNLSRKKHVAAIGYVQSLDGDWISRYRTYEYTWGQTVTRRIQAFFGVIPVVPGPTACIHSDIFNKLDFASETMTEDFDATLQIYRDNHGRIKFIPNAVIYTQDPLKYKDFVNQITRWYRGYFQSIIKHRISSEPTKIDYYLFYLCAQAILYSLLQFVIIPLAAILSGNPAVIALLFLTDLAIFMAMAIMTAIVSRRLNIMAAFPLFYVARTTAMFVFIKSFTEVVLLKRFRDSGSIWETRGRRYRINIDREKVSV